MGKLSEMSPGLRRFMGGFAIVLSFLSFIAGPILVFVGIILSVANGNGLPAAIYIPSGIGAFISGFFTYAIGDFYSKYDSFKSITEQNVTELQNEVNILKRALMASGITFEKPKEQDQTIQKANNIQPVSTPRQTTEATKTAIPQNSNTNNEEKPTPKPEQNNFANTVLKIKETKGTDMAMNLLIKAADNGQITQEQYMDCLDKIMKDQ
jgi:hypothetical protein